MSSLNKIQCLRGGVTPESDKSRDRCEHNINLGIRKLQMAEIIIKNTSFEI